MLCQEATPTRGSVSDPILAQLERILALPLVNGENWVMCPSCGGREGGCANCSYTGVINKGD